MFFVEQEYVYFSVGAMLGVLIGFILSVLFSEFQTSQAHKDDQDR